jgi:hypothetical protein
MSPLGGLHAKHAVQRGIWVPTQHLLWDHGKLWLSGPVAGPSGCKLTSSQQSSIKYASPLTILDLGWLIQPWEDQRKNTIHSTVECCLLSLIIATARILMFGFGFNQSGNIALLLQERVWLATTCCVGGKYIAKVMCCYFISMETRMPSKRLCLLLGMPDNIVQ